MFFGKEPVKNRALKCPDCSCGLMRRTSEQISQFYQVTYFVCRNIACNASFCGSTQLSHRLSPPANPNPAVDLPYSDESQEARRERKKIEESRKEKVMKMLEEGYSQRRIETILMCGQRFVKQVKDEMAAAKAEEGKL